jgi:hypothetical protein
MKKVQVTINIPEGYELACDEMRAPRRGEPFLDPQGEPVVATFDYSETKYPILKKAWQPEEGMYYKFWDKDQQEFTEEKPSLARFIRMNKNGGYVDEHRDCWQYCAPINPEELGK